MMILINTDQPNGLLNHFPDLNYFHELHPESALLVASEEIMRDLRTIC